MGYSWVFLGDAELASGSLEAWLDQVADPATVCGGLDPAVLESFGLADHACCSPPTVREVLMALATEEVARVSFDGPVCVRVLAPKDGDGWLTWRGALVAAFVALTAHGGRGRLEVVGDEVGPDEGFRLEVEPSARLTSLDESEVERVRSSAAYAEVMAIADEVYQLPINDCDSTQPAPPPEPGSYEEFAIRTIAERALFDARDGLKRIERRVLWALYPDGAKSALEEETITARVTARHPKPGAVDGGLGSLVSRRRTASLALVEETNGLYRLTPMAAEALSDLAVEEPAAFTDDSGSDSRVLSLPVPWLLLVGGQAIAVGLQCDLAPMQPQALLRATLERLATPPVVASTPHSATATAVLIGGTICSLDMAGLLDAYVAHRRETLARRGVESIDERITAELRRYLET